MNYSTHWQQNCKIAEALGLSWVGIEEECSQFTPGSHWEPGSEIYTVTVFYAAPQDVLSKLQDDGDDDEWQAHLMPDYMQQRIQFQHSPRVDEVASCADGIGLVG